MCFFLPITLPLMPNSSMHFCVKAINLSTIGWRLWKRLSTSSWISKYFFGSAIKNAPFSSSVLKLDIPKRAAKGANNKNIAFAMFFLSSGDKSCWCLTSLTTKAIFAIIILISLVIAKNIFLMFSASSFAFEKLIFSSLSKMLTVA